MRVRKNCCAIVCEVFREGLFLRRVVCRLCRCSFSHVPTVDCPCTHSRLSSSVYSAQQQCMYQVSTIRSLSLPSVSLLGLCWCCRYLAAGRHARLWVGKQGRHLPRRQIRVVWHLGVDVRSSDVSRAIGAISMWCMYVQRRIVRIFHRPTTIPHCVFPFQVLFVLVSACGRRQERGNSDLDQSC